MVLFLTVLRVFFCCLVAPLCVCNFCAAFCVVFYSSTYGKKVGSEKWKLITMKTCTCPIVCCDEMTEVFPLDLTIFRNI